jgi:transposase
VQILVPDNAATATHRKARGDAARFVTDRYRLMADHYGVAVVPARVRKPRDKAAVESGVNVVNKRVIGYLVEETWTTLAELNDAIGERVFEINHEIRRAEARPASSCSARRKPRRWPRCRARRSSKSNGRR